MSEIPASGRRRKLTFYGLFFGLQAVVGFVGLELVSRVLDPLGISYYPETASLIDTLVVEEPIGYRNRPGLEGKFYGAPVRISSQGLRDREVPDEPAPGESRVLIVGDSVPFGVGVTYEDSIPHQLERFLNDASEGPRYRTINMGTISYNTEQELIQLREAGLGMKPDIVALMYMDNDIQSKMWIFERRGAWYIDLIQRSYAACLLARVYKQVTGLGPIGVVGEEYTRDNPRWTVVENSLLEIHSLCVESDIDFVVFTFRRNAMVSEVGSRAGFPVISLWEDEHWTRTGETPAQYANSRTDSHPNPEGSTVYARLMHEGLVSLGLVPSGDGSPAAADRPEGAPAGP